MNLGFYTDTFFPDVGGAEIVLDNLVRQLAARGESVSLFAPQPKNHAASPSVPYNVERYRRPFSKRIGVQTAIPRLVQWHRKHQLDVIHCHAAYPQAFLALTLKKWFGVPIAVRPHGSDILPGERIRKQPKLEQRLIQSLSKVDAIVAQGAFLKNVICEMGIDAAKVHVIHNGVDLNTFADAKPYAHPRPYILGLGNLSRRKGFDLLIRAYAALSNPTADLLIAGTGAEMDALQQLAGELGVREGVRFVGQVSGGEKVSLYRSAQFFVCPSRREPFANVLLEALASDLPIVATDVGGNPELVRDGEHGIVCPNSDVPAMTTAIAKLMTDKNLRDQYLAAANRFVQDFDWPQVAQQYLQLYRDVSVNLSEGAAA